MNRVHFSSKTDKWATPRDLAAKLVREFGVTLDVCADERNTVVPHFFDRDIDGLAREWCGTCWMNPPYGRQIGLWVAKAAISAATGQAAVVCLLPARTDTSWWQTYCEPVRLGLWPGEVRLLRGRLKFGGAKNGAPFPSALVVFGRHKFPAQPSRDAWLRPTPLRCLTT